MINLRKKFEEFTEQILQHAERFYNPQENEITPLEELNPEVPETIIDDEPIEKLPWIRDIEKGESKKVLPTIPIPYRWRLGLGFIVFVFCLIGTGQLLISIKDNLNSLIFMLPLTFIQLDYIMKTWKTMNGKWYHFAQVKDKE